MGLVSRVVKALTKAESEVTRLEQAVVRWQTEAETKRQELLELEASAGDRLLADTTGALARELAVDAQGLRFSVDGAQAAAKAAERQLRAARWELALAQAAEKRDQAAKLTAAADAHQVKVDELLRQLTELDGATYVPEPELFGEERQAAVYNGGYTLPIRPKAEHLRGDAEDLLADAARLEQRVADERRQAAILVPTARLLMPDTGDVLAQTAVECAVNDGQGSATFEVFVDEEQKPSLTVTLPDERGRRGFRKLITVRPAGGRVQIRCNGHVLAHGQRPGLLRAIGGVGTYVDLS